ncbi:hypothetical protein FJ958_22080 [Mesorhizobium sp. B2-3-5]|nr:hypothetical protein FJ958_22080 [Mesorhizobium sp. B2-3-5]
MTANSISARPTEASLPQTKSADRKAGVFCLGSRILRRQSAFAKVSAAPHPPAGTFSPYRDGEKRTDRNAGAGTATLEIGEILGAGCLSPRPYTGS